jgi:CRISPR/Cas system-associated exonuclease Cas4 (RecB family)
MLEFQLPEHVSHSAINNYLRCGKAYELGKLGVEETPAWWLLGGSAVHTATEWIDKGEWDDAPEFAFHLAFQQEIERTLEVYPDDTAWRKAGYGARAQGYEHWIQQGPRYVKQWAEKNYRWVHVELDVSTTLPSGVVVKGYVDRVARDGNDGWGIYDLKTGSTRPDSDQQLGIYKVLFEEFRSPKDLEFGTGTTRAFNYMFKDDEFYEMDVSKWTLHTVDQIAQEWLHGIQSSVFLPNRGKQCGSCGLSSACYLASGDSNITRRFDRLNPHHGK